MICSENLLNVRWHLCLVKAKQVCHICRFSSVVCRFSQRINIRKRAYKYAVELSFSKSWTFALWKFNFHLLKVQLLQAKSWTFGNHFLTSWNSTAYKTDIKISPMYKYAAFVFEGNHAIWSVVCAWEKNRQTKNRRHMCRRFVNNQIKVGYEK